jgi:acylphosphatase
MRVVQNIEFHSKNEYFAGYLQAIAETSGVKASVSLDDKTVTLVVDSEDANVERFSQDVSKYLPQSIYLGEIKNDTSVSSVKKNSSINSSSYPLSLCPKCLEGEVSIDTVCTHYSNEDTKPITDDKEYREQYSEGDALLITNPQKIDELFFLTPLEKSMLFSIEKPILKVTIKSQELKDITNKTFIKIQAFKTAKSLIEAKSTQQDFLFFAPSQQELSVVVVGSDVLAINDNPLTTNIEYLDSDKTVSRFLNIYKEHDLKGGALGLCFSNKEISFLAQSTTGVKRVLQFSPFNLVSVFDELKSRFPKLVENYQKLSPISIDDLDQDMDIFGFLAYLLELKPSFEAFSDKSLEFRGNGGVKIDIKFLEDKSDYAALIASVMSYKLAGTPTHHIAYSVFESFADFFITVYNELRVKLKMDALIPFGDRFSNSVALSRLISKLSIKKPYFSKMYALDE